MSESINPISLAESTDTLNTVRFPMQYLSDIKLRIKEAMVGACDDMLNFTDEPSRKFNAEYLFTVSAAKAINRLNGYHGDPYKIFLEKSTRNFSIDCLLPVKRGDPMKRGSNVYRIAPLSNEGDRKGRIDVTVYVDIPNSKYDGAQPLCAIEIKGFNPQRKLIVSDLKRNLSYLRLSGNTGRSVLGFTLFAAMHSFDRHDNESKIIDNVDLTKHRYHKYISELGSTNDIIITIESFTVSKECLGRIVHEDEYQLLDSDACHHFVGVVVCFLPNF